MKRAREETSVNCFSNFSR